MGSVFAAPQTVPCGIPGLLAPGKGESAEAVAAAAAAAFAASALSRLK